jgi:hypothetical protein
VAGEVEAASEPPSLGHVQLCAALVGEGPSVEDGVLEGQGVERLAIADGAELGDGHAVRPRPRRPSPPIAMNQLNNGQQHQCYDHQSSLHQVPLSPPRGKRGRGMGEDEAAEKKKIHAPPPQAKKRLEKTRFFRRNSGQNPRRKKRRRSCSAAAAAERREKRIEGDAELVFFLLVALGF